MSGSSGRGHNPDDFPLYTFWLHCALYRPQMPASLPSMSRTIRPYLRGVAFHITARTNGGAWFEQCEARIERIIIDGVRSSDARLVAHTVMPNHFHIVLRQGSRPLGWVMQPIMRRAALCAQRTHARQGHIFERPFRSHACGTPDYLRRAIVYTHLNPHRAGLCDPLGIYPWCSQRGPGDNDFCDAFDAAFVIPLFARAADATLSESLDDYHAYVRWRLQRDAAKVGIAPVFNEIEPVASGGDAYFHKHFGLLGGPIDSGLPDLRDQAKRVLAAIDDQVCLADLRQSYLGRAHAAVRKQLIAALLQAGYRVVAISRFLCVSETTVSKVGSEIRYASLGSVRNSAKRFKGESRPVEKIASGGGGLHISGI